MSANRMFQLIYLLLERGRLTAGELSTLLEVSVRTVYRDVDRLSAAGIPICTTQGKGGGVFLMDGYVLDRAAFSDEEQRLLLTALHALPDTGDADVLAKLSALFHREEEDWLQVNLTRWGESQWDNELFCRLKAAIFQRRAVEFRYASSSGGVRPRRVLPARLVFKGQGWYLQAWCLEREEYRTFRLSRMLDLTVTEQLFHRKLTPPQIDFEGEIPPMFRIACTLRFSPALSFRVYDDFDRACITPMEDGTLTVRAVFPDDSWLYGYLLSFGTGVEVLDPPALRQKLSAMASEISGRHAEHDTPCQV